MTSAHFGALTGLTYFNLHGCEARPDSPVRQLWALPGLKELHLDLLMPDLPATVDDMANSLHHLQGLAVLEHNLPLTQGMAQALALLPGLTSLQVHGLQLTGPLQPPLLCLKSIAVGYLAPAEQWVWLLGGTTSLRHLGWNSSTSPTLKLLLPEAQQGATSALSDLARSVSECGVCYLVLHADGGWLGHQSSSLSAAQVTALRPMARQLEKVFLCGFQLPAAALEAAVTCSPRLTIFTADRCSFVDLESGLNALLRLPCLAILELNDCAGLDLAALESYLREVTQLQCNLGGSTCTKADAERLQQMVAVRGQEAGVTVNYKPHVL